LLFNPAHETQSLMARLTRFSGVAFAWPGTRDHACARFAIASCIHAVAAPTFPDAGRATAEAAKAKKKLVQSHFTSIRFVKAQRSNIPESKVARSNARPAYLS